MATLILPAVFLLGDSNFFQVASALGSLGFVGAIVAFVTLGSTKRKASADADKVGVEVEGLRQQLTKQVLADVDKQLGRMREMVNEERTRAATAAQGQADAQAELAKAQLVLAETLEQASKERHALRNELAALGAENATLKIQMTELRSKHIAEVAQLRREIESLRAQQDTSHHGRRRDDPSAL